jgi:uncharacterized YccA/Bax inhibitor family protein
LRNLLALPRPEGAILPGEHMRTGNPTLNERTFSRQGAASAEEAMTIQGAVNKTLLLLGLAIATASYTWTQFIQGDQAFAMMLGFGGAAVGLVLGLVCSFKPNTAKITAPLYAAAEGLFLGGISAMMEARFEGIVIQAVALTFGVMLALLVVYKTGLIKVTENFRLGVAAATGAIALFYLVTFALRAFNIYEIPYVHESGLIGIGFSIFVVGLAALNLVLDFDFIENGAAQGAPKFMEWYAAFGLMVTLVWLYIEILRLLAKLRSR